MSEQAIRSAPEGDTFPSTLEGFRTRFATEKSCLSLLRRWRYPEGFRCPRCEQPEAWWLPSRKLHECQACGHQASLTAGTVFHRTRKPLRLWFQAMYLLVASKRSVSAVELQRQIGVSYPTAWTWLHKLRNAMDDRLKALLQGRVEVDEAYVGGVEEGGGGRSTKKKAVVVAAIEVPKGEPGFGRVRLGHLPDASRSSLEEFVSATVDEKAKLCTDEWVGYQRLEDQGLEHEAVNVSAGEEKAHELFPGVHRVFSLLKRVLLGTFHGAVRWKHLHRYLAGYEFAFNRREADPRANLFGDLLRAGLLRQAPTYRDLIAGFRTHPRFGGPGT